MRLLPTNEQAAMAESLRDVLAKACSPKTLREARDPVQRRRLHDLLADVGLFGLTVSQQYGGLGLDQRDAIVMFEETGRAAVPGPIAEQFAATQLLQSLPNDERAREWLPRLAAGTATATVAITRESLVESADEVDVLILASGNDVHLLEPSDVQLVANESIDSNRHQFSVDWQPSARTFLTSDESALSILRDHVLLAVSAQLVGLTRQLLDLAVRHVQTREQFGRPLGTFQAVQHRLADVAVAADFASPVVARAACSLVDLAPSASRDVAMAKVFASEAAEKAAYSGLQVHGAIGYTREHDFHLYAMRAWALSLAYGDPVRQRERVAADLMRAQPPDRYPTY